MKNLPYNIYYTELFIQHNKLEDKDIQEFKDELS